MSPTTLPAPRRPLEPYQGGRALMLGSLAVGGFGMVLACAGIFLGQAAAPFSYLVGFTYWLGIAVASLVWLACFLASKARWMVVLRRMLEVQAVSVAIFAVLFLPLALSMARLWEWVSPPSTWTHEEHALLAHKQVYLNVTAFLVRAAAYFVCWIVISQLLHRWSLRQDAVGGHALTQRQRVLGAASLPVLAISLTFAAFDWLMSLYPFWSSSIFGVYYFAGSFLSAMALLTLVTVAVSGTEWFGTLVTPAHLHNLGKLLLAFTVFWAYIGFSQLLLVWIANLPEEVTWYRDRIRNGWQWVGIALVLVHFVLPFLVLLSRGVKLRRDRLAVISIWILLAHYLDLYFMVMPRVDAAPSPHWTDPAAFVGIGGVAIAFGLFVLRGRPTVPVRDPYLADSLRYQQP